MARPASSQVVVGPGRPEILCQSGITQAAPQAEQPYHTAFAPLPRLPTTTDHTTPLPTPSLPPSLQTFDFERWRTHRSSSRFWRHMAGLAQSNTVRKKTEAALPTPCIGCTLCGLTTVQRLALAWPAHASAPLSQQPPPQPAPPSHAPGLPRPVCLPAGAGAGAAAGLRHGGVAGGGGIPRGGSGERLPACLPACLSGLLSSMSFGTRSMQRLRQRTAGLHSGLPLTTPLPCCSPHGRPAGCRCGLSSSWPPTRPSASPPLPSPCSSSSGEPRRRASFREPLTC